MIYKAINNNIDLALKLILSGEIIIYPTDTIYGFGVDATNQKAIHKLNRLKKRVSPLSIIVSSYDMIREFVDFKFKASDEIKKYLPGAYTILLNNNNNILPNEIGLDTGKIGIRIPNSKFITKLVEKINKPIITTSVNIHNSHSLNDIDSIYNNFSFINIFSKELDVKSKVSTIIDFTCSPYNVLRQGDGLL